MTPFKIPRCVIYIGGWPLTMVTNVGSRRANPFCEGASLLRLQLIVDGRNKTDDDPVGREEGEDGLGLGLGLRVGRSTGDDSNGHCA